MNPLRGYGVWRGFLQPRPLTVSTGIVPCEDGEKTRETPKPRTPGTETLSRGVSRSTLCLSRSEKDKSAERGLSIVSVSDAYRELNAEPRSAVRPVKRRPFAGGPPGRLACDQERPLA